MRRDAGRACASQPSRIARRPGRRTTATAARRNGSADCRVEPQRGTASLPRVPNGNDLLRFGDRFPFGFGAPCLGRRPRGGALPFLRSAVGTHEREANRCGPSLRCYRCPLTGVRVCEAQNL